jgi:hypothetical protein
MAGEQVSQGQTNRIKLLVSAIMEKIRTGDAPDQLVAMYEKIGGEGFGYWLHGLLCGLVGREELIKSEFLPFFNKIIGEN